MGFVEEIKSIFTEKTIMGLGYATVSGLASGTLGAIFERWLKNKYAGYIGDIFGGAIMAYVADKYLGRPEWKGYAIFGAIFPPVWEAVTDKISPDKLANKVGETLGLTWEQASMSAYEEPFIVEVTPTESEEPHVTQTQTAEVFNF